MEITKQGCWEGEERSKRGRVTVDGGCFSRRVRREAGGRAWREANTHTDDVRTQREDMHFRT